ncbi:hypothetical protein [Shewanella sp. 10N.286.48.B5]|uniref:hypothetical protein n=1 Tax=Shewanella sp. 10N.286.48.B5 TaxID=1880834 RepID=UPI000C8566B4|nr:hypothetical protein [Shewanella sp. 10N.286.48.B5]PMH88831.1 hypothetical protein BCU57_19435 [Shewanella sp. 10N.286.48.B5]
MNDTIVLPAILKHILIKGILLWGISTAILFQLIMHLTGEEHFFDGIVLSLITFPIGGIFYGYLTWRLQHKE